MNSESQNHVKWDSELFLVSAPSPEALRTSLEHLRDAAVSSQLSFCDFAKSCFPASAPAFIRLAIIATDFEDLTSKISRASERISDDTKSIRDISGIYYTTTPLGIDDNGNKTKIGFIFPGEGSQYPGMLSDLAELFPHVRDILRHCDDLNQSLQTKDKPTTRFFTDTSPLSDQEIAEMEADLKRLDFAMFAAMIADWIMLTILENLGINCDTIAGHSGGELVALMAARVLVGSEEQFSDLADGFRELGKFTPENAVDCKLIALGTSAEKAQSMIDAAAREQGRDVAAFVAMRNCPHQTVIVGEKADIELVEKVVQKKGMLYQQLDLEQPYHTPLFEPYMLSLRKMFEGMSFYPAESPIYSCTTGELFPDDPATIAELTLSHWESPVRFIELIENQYRDGVRCFIEVGPRNNLCSFAEDILRGRDALIVPSNLQRSPGITQVNHLVGQLFIHHFDVNPEFLYQVRETETLGNPVETPRTPVPENSNREAVMLSHLQLMEDFLELQQQVMQSYVSGEPAEDYHPIEYEPPSPAEYPMVDDIVDLEPGVSIVARRSMFLDEDFFSAQHTVGGRELSAIDPEQYGLPVVPMTFSIEMLAEVAQSLFPDLKVVSMSEIKLYKWLDYDNSAAAFAQVSASVNIERTNDSVVTLDAELFHWKGDETPNFDRPAVTATIELGAAFPEPPPAETFEVINERPCSVSTKVLYQNLFHGEEYQGVEEIGLFGDDGIEAQVRVLPRERLFESIDNPEFVFDPVLLDVALHPMCAWHLEQEDQSGRILLPVGLDRIDFFGPRPDVGTGFSSRGKMKKETTRQFTQEIELVDTSGRVWCRMEGSHYWRFYLPFRKFNFHGPKNIYMLSEEWENAPVLEDCLTQILKVPNDLRNPTMQPIGARVTLSDREFEEFQSLNLPPERQTQWLFGRIAAKETVRALWFQKSGERLYTADVEIDHDENGRPFAFLRGRETPPDMPHVSLSHSGMNIAAIASGDRHIGIDIEKIVPREKSFLGIAFTSEELALLNEIDPESPEWAARFWCAKEAVGKALGHGLLEGPRSIKILSADPHSGKIHAALSGSMLESFPAYREKAIAIATSTDKKLAIAVTRCETAPIGEFRRTTNVS